MIVTRIIGGLGNQMFQYAAARSLALASGCQLKLDISGFANYRLHNGYELDLFNIKAGIANSEEVSRLVGVQPRLARFVHKKFGLGKKTYFVERTFTFDSHFLRIKPPCYLDGYWQSYKYFEHFATQIRDELTPKRKLAGQNLKIAEQIGKVNSISIHIRRGDYVTNQAANKVHGFIGAQYYKLAIQRIVDDISNPYFFVFSDDLEWARSNLGLAHNTTFVDHNKGKWSYEDMRLMSLCQHHIIANSTFSWWGAWLNPSANKIVIAPSKWFANENNVADLIPPGWVQL